MSTSLYSAVVATAARVPRYSRLEADERRDLILAAARRVFVRTNPQDASTAEIAREAGVTRGLVHHYFGTKRGLYLAVVADLAAALPELVHTDLTGRPIDDVVEVNLVSWLDSIERDHELWMALLGAGTVGHDPEVDAILSDARDQAIERMAANQAQGAEPTEELRLILRVFMGAVEAAAREWAMHGRASREQVHVLLKGTVLAMVGTVLPALPKA